MDLSLVHVSELMSRQFLTIERSQWTGELPRDQDQLVLLTDRGRPCGAAYSGQLAHWLERHPQLGPDAFAWLPVREIPASMPVSAALDDTGTDVVVVTDSAGAPAGILHWCDVARFHREEYHTLQARFVTAVDTLEESLSMIDQSGRVVAWNRAAERLFGIKPGDIIGRQLADFFPERDQWSLQALATGTSVRQALHEPHPGTWVIINSAPVLLGDRIIGALAVEQNVTNMVRLHEQLYRTTSEFKALEGEISRMRQSADPFARITGRGPATQSAVAIARKVASSDATVLIRGESGVGKDVFAKAIHDAGERRDKPFVAINCGAIPAPLFESELFGYERGAFTGADQKGKSGKLEQAQGGTLFLDEVAELPMETQVKLLRVLQDRRFYRLGGDKPRMADVRIVAATNRNLEEMLRQGTFREDLYFRLDVVSLEVPPLRSRLDDLADLVHDFAQEFAMRYKRPIQGIQPDVMLALMNYTWPGNIRELRNVMERLVVLADDYMIKAEFLPLALRKAGAPTVMALPESPRGLHAPAMDAPALHAPALHAPAMDAPAMHAPAPVAETTDLAAAAKEAQRKAILAALAAAGQNRSLAAKRLGISRSVLYYQMKRLGLA